MFDEKHSSVHRELEALRHAANFVERGELRKAVELLKDVFQDGYRSEKLINALSTIYHMLGEHDKAKSYDQALVQNLGSADKFSDSPIPNQNDFSFLEEQYETLNEEEYSFERLESEKRPLAKKTLSLGKRKKSASDDKPQSVIIFQKNKHRESTNQCPQLREESDVVETKPANPVAKSINDDTTIIESQNEITDFVELAQDYQLFDEDTEELSIVEQENALEAIDPDTIDILVDESDSEDEALDPSIFGGAEDENIDELDFESNETEIYALWDDEPLDDDIEDIDSAALDNSLTIEERARLVAVECILEFGWHTSKLPFLIEIFSGMGWSNSKKALEREVELGATYEEIELALAVKELWQDSSRYWITFSKAWNGGESADSTYRHFSWKQALRLVRLFDGLPSFEELHDFLESEFDYWYQSSLLRRCFPAFNKYLFKYRLNSRNLNSLTGAFDIPVAHDGMNGSWSYHTHTSEMVKLKEFGIDLLSNFAPKSYYASDKYTDEKLLKLYHTKVRQQGEME